MQGVQTSRYALDLDGNSSVEVTVDVKSFVVDIDFADEISSLNNDRGSVLNAGGAGIC